MLWLPCRAADRFNVTYRFVFIPWDSDGHEHGHAAAVAAAGDAADVGAGDARLLNSDGRHPDISDQGSAHSGRLSRGNITSTRHESSSSLPGKNNLKELPPMWWLKRDPKRFLYCHQKQKHGEALKNEYVPPPLNHACLSAQPRVVSCLHPVGAQRCLLHLARLALRTRIAPAGVWT